MYISNLYFSKQLLPGSYTNNNVIALKLMALPALGNFNVVKISQLSYISLIEYNIYIVPFV